MLELKFDYSDLLSDLNGMINGLNSAVDMALQEAGEVVAQEESKRNKGELSKSFYTYRDGDNQIIDSKKDYAQYIEYGRGPVRAINAKVLRFVIGGEVIFRKSVGPAKAQPYIRDSLNAAEGKFVSIFEKHINGLK